MRHRSRILADLDQTYRAAFDRAEREGDKENMARLEFDFLRDQLLLEVGLDLRELLTDPSTEEEPQGKSLLDHAKALRNLSKGRLP